MGSRIRMVAAVAVITGCGRIGFGEDRDAATTGDGVIVIPDAHGCVAGADTCNAIDDDCDGALDEDCSCEPFTLRTELAIEPLDAPAIAWTGDGYVVVVSIGDAFALQRVSATGALVGGPELVIGAGPLGPTQAIYTGAQLAVTWRDATGAGWFGFMNLTGDRFREDRSLGVLTDGPFMDWNGSVIAMVTYRQGFPIEFARYDGDGDGGGGTGLVGVNDETRFVRWVGTGFVVGLRERTNPRSARYYDWSADATELGSVRQVGGTRTGFVDAATAGAGGILATALLDSGGVVVVPHDLAGASAPEVVVDPEAGETDLAVAIASTGTRHLVVATDATLGGERARVIVTGSDGEVILPIEQIPPMPTTPAVVTRPTAIAAAAGRVAATWTDAVGGSPYLIVIQRCEP